MGAVVSALKEEAIAYSYLGKMVGQLLFDKTIRSKTTLWTFLSGFMSIAVDEMIHQSQCSTCEDRVSALRQIQTFCYSRKS